MSNQPCIIGNKITIRGNLTGDEPLVVEGRIEGSIALTEHLTVANSGTVEADVDVEAITVHGAVRGEIRAANSVTIGAQARVIGNVRAPRIVIEDGAMFKGQIEMDFDLPADVDGVKEMD
jgi:cytoskeletal protein CcmA (bactofilin family)